jgi:hypothetical protein
MKNVLKTWQIQIRQCNYNAVYGFPYWVELPKFLAGWRSSKVAEKGL